MGWVGTTGETPPAPNAPFVGDRLGQDPCYVILCTVEVSINVPEHLRHNLMVFNDMVHLMRLEILRPLLIQMPPEL